MASIINVDGLTLNAVEKQDFREFIIEQVIQRESLTTLHNVMTGVQMKEQIVFAGQMSMTGVKAGTDCARGTSGATSTLTQKYTEPVGIEDLISHCNKQLNALFKAYFGKIQKYKDIHEIEGTDLEVFLAILLEESMSATVWRAIWFGDVDVAAADASNEGLIDANNVKFFDYFDGLWKQIFTGVTATDIAHYAVTENGETTKAAQLALANGRAEEIFYALIDLAPSTLNNNPDATFYVSKNVFNNYYRSLQKTSQSFELDRTLDGFQQLTFDGRKVVNMEFVWDEELKKFTDNTTNNAYYLPNRVVYTVPANLAVTTLNDGDFSEIDTNYEWKERLNHLAFGFTLDSLVLEESQIVVAY